MPQNGRKNIFTDRQSTNKNPLMFLDLKDNNFFFGLCEQTRKEKCMYFMFKNLEVSSKIGQQKPKSSKQITNDVF